VLQRIKGCTTEASRKDDTAAKRLASAVETEWRSTIVLFGASGPQTSQGVSSGKTRSRCLTGMGLSIDPSGDAAVAYRQRVSVIGARRESAKQAEC
jgi:hypothetical protein